MTQPDYGGDNLAALHAAAHGADEAGVDFYLVEWQHVEMPQARVAGAEVVERQPHAQRFKLVQ